MFKLFITLLIIFFPITTRLEGSNDETMIMACCIEFKEDNYNLEKCIKDIIGNYYIQTREGACHYCSD